MLIYRIEHAESGKGPIRSAGLFPPRVQKTHFNRLPCPWEDDLGWIDDPAEVCGCISVRQLLKWFPRHIRQFVVGLGYELCVYDVRAESVRIGHTQVLFNYREARPVFSRSL